MPKPTSHHAYISGKGSRRRPCLVPEEEFEKNWDAVFGQKSALEFPLLCKHANESPAQCRCPTYCYCHRPGGPCRMSTDWDLDELLFDHAVVAQKWQTSTGSKAEKKRDELRSIEDIILRKYGRST